MPRDDERADPDATALATNEATEPETTEQTVYLDDGRQLAITRDGRAQAVEIRAASGQLELRIRLTEDGPVLSLESVKLELHSTSSVDIQCETFNVTASDSAAITSGGSLQLKAEGELGVDSTADVRVIGAKIHLN